MRNPFNSRLGAVVAGSAVIAVVSGTSAYAASQITSAQIKDQTIQSQDIGPGAVGSSELKSDAATISKLGPGVRDNVNAVPNKADVGLDGAVYRIAHYDNGGGGRATVACSDDEATSQKYTAIAGGARSEAVNGGSTDTQPITSSFPGRMDWSTNTPKANRLDGWIVNFGGGAAPTADSGTLEIWALCVPTDTIKTEVSHY